MEAVVCWIVMGGIGELKGGMTACPIQVLFWILGAWKSKRPTKSDPNLIVRQL